MLKVFCVVSCSTLSVNCVAPPIVQEVKTQIKNLKQGHDESWLVKIDIHSLVSCLITYMFTFSSTPHHNARSTGFSHLLSLQNKCWNHAHKLNYFDFLDLNLIQLSALKPQCWRSVCSVFSWLGDWWCDAGYSSYYWATKMAGQRRWRGCSC